MTQTQQPEALRLAEQCDNFDKRAPIAACLRAQHARIQELELNLTHRQEVYTASLEQIVCLQDRIAELEQGKCLHQIAEPAQVVEAQDLYYLQDARHHAMVGNCPSFWREGGGYTTNLDEAERFTLEAAMKQHKCRETDLPWLCTEVDKLRRPTVDCQFMPRSWGAQRSALAAQAKQGGAA